MDREGIDINKLNIDSHKLFYHVPRVYDWYRGKEIFPIYLEIGLSGACNQRCIFCAFDYLKYKKVFFAEESVKKLVHDAAKCGVKSILYSGEGEPLLHSKIGEIVNFTKEEGIDVAISTNGILLNRALADKLLANLVWIRISLNAGTKNNYAFMHGTKKEDFCVIIKNIRDMMQIRNKNKYKCTINIQTLLMPQNYKEVIKIAEILSDLGVDCLVLKPYSQHCFSKNIVNYKFKVTDLLRIEDKFRKNFKGRLSVVFRYNSLEKLSQSKPYGYCLGLPFMAHISCDGNIYPCNAFIGNRRFSFGNVSENSFKHIWLSKKRKSIMEFITNKWDIQNCRKSCRLDEINRYLWELKNPSGHVNFI